MEVGPAFKRFCETTYFTAKINDPCESHPTELIADGFPNILSAP